MKVYVKEVVKPERTISIITDLSWMLDHKLSLHDVNWSVDEEVIVIESDLKIPNPKNPYKDNFKYLDTKILYEGEVYYTFSEFIDTTITPETSEYVEYDFPVAEGRICSGEQGRGSSCRWLGCVNDTGTIIRCDDCLLYKYNKE